MMGEQKELTESETGEEGRRRAGTDSSVTCARKKCEVALSASVSFAAK